jgi:hypothetical protein
VGAVYNLQARAGSSAFLLPSPAGSPASSPRQHTTECEPPTGLEDDGIQSHGLTFFSEFSLFTHNLDGSVLQRWMCFQLCTCHLAFLKPAGRACNAVAAGFLARYLRIIPRTWEPFLWNNN